ncbi:probable RNA polymerase II nuclear localization protein SLC7A6OS [Amyelois transitella]|uniref:probable RNA polymerase II nuclear localization protein SLC7A6OS n=1 Tax=Amyelois transitella TaxID=680683 RepID=UPI00067E1FE1|nr:probable RNA polymerase II nuclear localization protein SLC7A6OS [Amyelois transitella]
MASTVLRVKRRLEDNPQDALVLMCKRIKRDTEEISSSLFVFRGTVDSQEATNVQDIVPKSKTKLKRSHSISDIIEKIRQEKKDSSSQSRYEVVNCNRGLKDAEKQYDLVDLQKNEDIEGDVQYAYDLYTAAKPDFDVSMLDNLVSIENYETDLIFGTYRDNGYRPSSDEEDDDDDSNDENNWRNDYPDSEHSSINEEDMIRAMENVDLEDDLSSDTGEDKIYDQPNPFNEDVLRYGPAYAKYKARVLSEEGDTNNSSLIQTSTVPDYGYKEDSDDGFYYGQEEDMDQFREQYGSDSSDCDPD